jgi:hypothetical protein
MPARPRTTPVEALDSNELATPNGRISPTALIGTPRLTCMDGQATPSRPSGRAMPI